MSQLIKKKKKLFTLEEMPINTLGVIKGNKSDTDYNNVLVYKIAKNSIRILYEDNGWSESLPDKYSGLRVQVFKKGTVLKIKL